MNQKKITFVGGGSSKFVRELVVDLFSYPKMQDSRIVLMDTDGARALRSERIVSKIIEELDVPATVCSTTDRREAIDGADHVIITIMVGGLDAYHQDVAIPAKYGVFQTVSDTTGPGGVMRILRTAPALERIAGDILELAPSAWVLNYANPMSMNVLALSRFGLEKAVGLCHSIQGTYPLLAAWAGVPPEEVRYTAGGINHTNFYLTLTHLGEDLYPRILANRAAILAAEPAEIVRLELLEYLGYFPAEGPFHTSEYYPWFRKNEAEVKRMAAKTFWGYELDSKMYHDRTAEIEAQIAGRQPICFDRSSEYGARVIQALEGGVPETFYGNVPNRGLIENLPSDAIVEVPCVADSNGTVAGRVGTIPPQLAAVMRPHIALHDLAVTGVITKDRRLLYQAVQADPLTGAILTLPRIRQMMDELLAANSAYTSHWK